MFEGDLNLMGLQFKLNWKIMNTWIIKYVKSYQQLEDQFDAPLEG